MEEKKYVVCQNNWILTPALPEARADYEKNRLSEWFSGLVKVEAAKLGSSLNRKDPLHHR